MTAVQLAALVVWSVAMLAAAIMCLWCACDTERKRAAQWDKLEPGELLPERRYAGPKITVDKSTERE